MPLRNEKARNSRAFFMPFGSVNAIERRAAVNCRCAGWTR